MAQFDQSFHQGFRYLRLIPIQAIVFCKQANVPPHCRDIQDRQDFSKSLGEAPVDDEPFKKPFLQTLRYFILIGLFNFGNFEQCDVVIVHRQVMTDAN